MALKDVSSVLSSCDEMKIDPVPTRSYYPDYTAMLTHLFCLKNAVKSGDLTDTKLIKSEMVTALRIAERLGVYYDYCDHTCYRDGEMRYGAEGKDYPLGGGSGYPAIAHPDFTASHDEELHDNSRNLESGQILLVTKDAVIDLSDLLIAGDYIAYVPPTKIPFRWTVKNGTSWVGERGVDGCGGPILRVTSYTDFAIVVGENARLSGLCIQGPDLPTDVRDHEQNFSVGILVKGNGAVIENCEISGFYRTAIRVEGAQNVTIRNNYIHDILAPASGHAVSLENATADIYGNLFANVTEAVSVKGENASLDFHDNIDAGNITSAYVLADGGSVSLKNNTFLSPIDLVINSGDFTLLSAENNLFAYPQNAYGDAVKVDVFKNNVFDIKSPVVYSGCANLNVTLKPFDIPLVKASCVSYDFAPQLPALQSVFYTENCDVGYRLLKQLCREDIRCDKAFLEKLTETIALIGGYTNYLRFLDEGMVCMEVGGEKYGAYPDGDMIGGGYGYSKIFTTGDYIVTNEKELFDAIAVAKAGEVIFLPGDVYINLSDCEKNQLRSFVVPAGVTLASDRGCVREDGTVSSGAVIANTYQTTDAMIHVGGEKVCLAGLVLRGPDPGRHMDHGRRYTKYRTFEPMRSYYWQIPVNHGVECGFSNVEFYNLEVCGFNTIGINISNQNNPPQNVRVHHCYIHHNQLSHLGYGVKFGCGYADVSYNMFNYNRHSISGTGAADSGFKANNNIEMGESIGHYFDMHGGIDRKDGTNIAGEYMLMCNNAFLGPWRPYVLRGHPTDQQDFSFNVVYEVPSVLGDRLSSFSGGLVENATVGKNIWGLNYGNREVLNGLE